MHVARNLVPLVLATFITLLNETSLAVALPQLMVVFAVDATTVQWVVTGFLLVLAIVIPTTGFLMQRYSIRRLFLVAMSLFLVGTVLGAIATEFWMLLAGRIVQAGGTGLLIPMLMVTTFRLVAPERRGFVMGINSIVISVAPGLGPAVAGVILAFLDWRGLFAVMLPVAVLALVLGALGIRVPHEPRDARIDLLSVALSTVTFGLIVSAIALAEHGGWFPIAAAVIGALALAGFVARQIRLQRDGRALLDLRPFLVHNFRISLLIVGICMATMVGSMTVLPIGLQTGLGLTALVTGLLLLPGGVVQATLAPIVGRIYDRRGPVPLVLPGAILLAGGQWLLALIGQATPIWLIIVFQVVLSAGMAILMATLLTHALASLPAPLHPHGSAIMSTAQQLFAATGTAVLVGAMAIAAAGRTAAGADVALASADGVRTAFIVGGCVALVAVIAAPFVRRNRISPGEWASESSDSYTEDLGAVLVRVDSPHDT